LAHPCLLPMALCWPFLGRLLLLTDLLYSQIFITLLINRIKFKFSLLNDFAEASSDTKISQSKLTS